MVQCFWDKKKLTWKDSKGAIKLIPKNKRRHLLQNWTPITLLTMTYKIIVIDQDMIFVKLDFMKAYSRVAHEFLWYTFATMGIGANTISRIKGLVVGGTSAVHINWSFMEEFIIMRGVREGCPLAPLLFVMTMQPLMRVLWEEERLGNIKGLNVGEGHSLLNQLFADDTKICITAEEWQFERLKELRGVRTLVQEFSLGLESGWESQTRTHTVGKDSARKGE
ncbi:hypothetical protein R1sor_012815 [Riccia sorocarpa]|uniref:Reverse transcriptase domain-containing protein n=1 Tax=Riccia sorocarpa TaxID=122646 RepID=A0ABD3I6Q6_9MARC